MRSILAGIFLLLSAGTALGQATGYVTSLGFQFGYRPDCWTPLLVHLESSVSNPEEYQIRIHQQDLDRDIVVYTHNVTLGPNDRRDYWAYFRPQPVGSRADGGSLPARAVDLAEVLKVELYDKNGRNPIARLPVNFSANNLDPARDPGPYSRGRGRKLVLCVLEQDKPSWQEYADLAAGLSEDVLFIPVTPRDLPDSVLGYDGIDSILWLDADAQSIAAFGGQTLEAIKQYVRRGGQFVVCQPPTADRYTRIAPFADMLPVVARDDKGEWAIEPKSRPDLAPLVELARTRLDSEFDSAAWDGWAAIQASRPAWDVARARPRPDAVVDQWIGWDPNNAADVSPYLARRAYDLGSVVWVAQDLGSPSLVSAIKTAKPAAGAAGPGAGQGADGAQGPAGELRKQVQGLLSPEDWVISRGWAHIWDHVFGWNNATFTRRELEVAENSTSKNKPKDVYQPGNIADLGGSLLRGMEHSGRGAALILLAVFFFIGYWVVAGPGSYLFLAARKRRGLSWLVFGVSALVATVVTVGVVKLVLRGRPEVRHVSIVRLTPGPAAADGSPQFTAVIDSRIGLYIPRDGDQRVAVVNTTPGRVSTLSPFAIHPQFMLDNKEGFLDQAKYVVNTDQFASGQPVAVDVPYRSTLKKLQAEWSGMVPQGVFGSIKLVEPKPVTDAKGNKGYTGPLMGKLLNKSGQNLYHVYFCFSRRPPDATDLPRLNQEEVLYVPSWPKDAALDLDAEYQQAKGVDPVNGVGPTGSRVPSQSARPVRGLMVGSSWPTFWYRELGTPMGDLRFDDSESGFVRSFPMMALFDRIPPQAGEPSDYRRWDLLRHGGRDLNVSQLVASGQMVILAQAVDSPVPVPLEVEGDKMEGDGVVLYEVALPLDRSALATPPAPATQPGTQPTTQPATRPATRPATPAAERATSNF